MRLFSPLSAVRIDAARREVDLTRREEKFASTLAKNASAKARDWRTRRLRAEKVLARLEAEASR